MWSLYPPRQRPLTPRTNPFIVRILLNLSLLKVRLLLSQAAGERPWGWLVVSKGTVSDINFQDIDPSPGPPRHTSFRRKAVVRALRCSDFPAHCPACGFFAEAQRSLSCSFVTFLTSQWLALLLTGSSACPSPPSLAVQHCVGLNQASPLQGDLSLQALPTPSSHPTWRPHPPLPLCHSLSLSPPGWLV